MLSYASNLSEKNISAVVSYWKAEGSGAKCKVQWTARQETHGGLEVAVSPNVEFLFASLPRRTLTLDYFCSECWLPPSR